MGVSVHRVGGILVGTISGRGVIFGALGDDY